MSLKLEKSHLAEKKDLDQEVKEWMVTLKRKGMEESLSSLFVALMLLW